MMSLSPDLPVDTEGWRERAARLCPEGRHFIDGDFAASADGATFEDINPATDEAFATIARGTATDVDRAVASARAAFRAGHWSRMAPRERMDILSRYAELIAAHTDDFALLDVLDTGKPVRNMTDEDVPASVTASGISPRRSTRSRARSPTPRATPSITSCASRSAWSAASCRGIIR